MNSFAGKPIVVPIDFSDEAARALDEALKISDSPTLVSTIHVAPPLNALEPAFAYHVVDDADRRGNLETAFARRHSVARSRGVDFQVRFGDPGQEIADFAKQVGAGLIVMPSHGRTGMAHLLIGSVAERVVRLAPCPVLVLRA
jgi:nucleotide-binding universal stress UspA family protein